MSAHHHVWDRDRQDRCITCGEMRSVDIGFGLEPKPQTVLFPERPVNKPPLQTGDSVAVIRIPKDVADWLRTRTDDPVFGTVITDILREAMAR